MDKYSNRPELGFDNKEDEEVFWEMKKQQDKIDELERANCYLKFRVETLGDRCISLQNQNSELLNKIKQQDHSSLKQKLYDLTKEFCSDMIEEDLEVYKCPCNCCSCDY